MPSLVLVLFALLAVVAAIVSDRETIPAPLPVRVRRDARRRR